jgi:two-component system chemotaxis response regulator CheB
MGRKIRVLLADGSSQARSLLRIFFQSGDDFDVVGEAKNGQEVVSMNRALRPGLVTMSLEMPLVGGLEAIEEIMSLQAVPILAVSDVVNAERAYAAIARGALLVTHKPKAEPAQIAEFLATARLVASIPVITHVRVPKARQPRRVEKPLPGAPPATAMSSRSNCRVFAVASSTGGPQALAHILSRLKPQFSCPILVAQHMAEGFTEGLSDWLSTMSTLPVRLAQDGASILLNTVYLARSEFHLAISPDHRFKLVDRKNSGIYHPSCTMLLASAAAVYGSRSVGIILTGMGSDGVEGMKDICSAGGQTFAQDEASSIIFGMNRVAIENGCVGKVLPLEQIADAMNQLAR